MKIQSYGAQQANQVYRRQTVTRQEGTTKQSFKDTLTISKDAQQLADTIQNERKAKVDKLRAAVVNGTYEMDIEKTAKNLQKFFS